MLVRLGAAGKASAGAASVALLTTVFVAAGTVTPRAFDFALVPADVVSVAV